MSNAHPIGVLLPCPFCGNKDMDGDEGVFEIGPCWYVRCGDPSCFAEVMRDFKDEAIGAWNRRATNDLELLTEASKYTKVR